MFSKLKNFFLRFLPVSKKTFNKVIDEQKKVMKSLMVDLAVKEHIYFKEYFSEYKPLKLGNETENYIAKDKKGSTFFIKLYFNEKINENLMKILELQQIICRLEGQGLPVLPYVNYGVSPRGVYSVYEWIDGQTLLAVLSKCTDKEKYQLGEKLGVTLRSLHDNNPAPNDYATRKWKAWVTSSVERYIDKYQKSKRSYEGDSHIIKHLRNNRSLLDERPLSLIHGDCNSRNVMVSKGGDITLIDFPLWMNRNRYYDPYYDLRDIYIYPLCPHFLTGYINGYTNSQPDDLFWQLLCYYSYTRYLKVALSQSRKSSYNTRYLQSLYMSFQNTSGFHPTWYLGERASSEYK